MTHMWKKISANLGGVGCTTLLTCRGITQLLKSRKKAMNRRSVLVGRIEPYGFLVASIWAGKSVTLFHGPKKSKSFYLGRFASPTEAL